MKVFLSSVRRGLEEERDALPAMIAAMGHEPRRFEDYTAKPVPSRDACLAGVTDADAYVLLLGEKYGDPLPDTGLSPTEEEFNVAKRRGTPVLVFRKRVAELEPEQAAFIARVEDYRTGRFRGSFSNTVELLPQVAKAIRELEQAARPLSFVSLAKPLAGTWRMFDRHNWRDTACVLEVIAIPLASTPLTATVLAAAPARLARVGREHGFFADDQALVTGLERSRAFAATRPEGRVPIAGIGITAESITSVWQEMPSDTLGVILDHADLAVRVGGHLRLGSEFLASEGQVALAVGLHGLGSVVEGSISDLGRRTSATMPGFGYGKSALVEPRDSVLGELLSSAAHEIGSELAMRLLLRFRDAVR